MEIVSVIVPVYNSKEFLNKCLESIVKQTYKHLEILLIDDGSTDGSGALCDMWASRDCRVKVIHQENGGVAAARNCALKVCTGEYLMFVDSDDYISDDAVQTLYERLSLDSSDMAIGGHIIVDDEKTDKTNAYYRMKDEIIDRMTAIGYLGQHLIKTVPWGKLYRREIFRGLSYPNLTCGEDTWLFTKLLDKCRKISIVDSIVYYYFQREGSLVHRGDEVTRYDTAISFIVVTRYLCSTVGVSFAKKWYAYAIDHACYVTGERRKKIIQSFSWNEQMRLLQGSKMSTRTKHLCLYIPWLFPVGQWLLRTSRVNKKNI